jgi:outer membrane protein OmpA-like peptidoglycan-associated protein
MSKNVDESQLTSTGYGQEHPIADNKTPAGKAANRRVELKLAAIPK